MDGSIKILDATQINIDKWNALVKDFEAPIYAQYQYINSMCKSWKALVWNDYELVLPLPYKKKFTIAYSYSVPFIQQLGFIGNLELAKNMNATIKGLKKVVRLGEIYANYKNDFLLQLPKDIYKKLNLVLPLHKPYNTLQQQFSKDSMRNIAKAEKQNLDYDDEIKIETCVQLYKENYGKKMSRVIETDFENFEILCHALAKTNQCFCRAVLLNDEVVACAILLKDNFKIYNVANTTTPKGKKLSANYFLFSHLLQEFCNNNLTFDFEGSEIVGVRKFYESFGAIPQPYFMWKFMFLRLKI
jgi:hypothetical protein